MKTFKEVQELTENVMALLCEEDKEVLYKYASQVPDEGIIVDIGTACGGSAFIMAFASKPKVQLYTIDPEGSESFFDNRDRFELKEKIYFLNETSKDAFSHLQYANIDMIFIDGVHSYDGVMDDFNTFGSRVKKGGIIAFHDIFLYDNTIGQAVKDLVTDGKIEEIETVTAFYKEDPRKIGLFVGRKL